MTDQMLKRAALLTMSAAVAAATTITTTTMADPPSTVAPRVMTVVLPTLGPPSIDEARELQGAGKWDAAAEAWHEIAEEDPDNAAAWFNLGYCLHAGGHLEDAIEVHRKAASFDEFRGIALYNLGCAYALTDQVDRAFEALEASQAAGFRLRGQAEGDSDLDSLHGDRRFQMLLDRDPAGGGGMQEALGRIHMLVEQRLPEIERRLQALVERAHQLLGQLHQMMAQDERFAGLAEQLQEFLGGMGDQRQHAESRPERSDAMDMSGVSIEKARQLQQAGKWLPAAKMFAAVTEAEPDNPAAWFGLAYCLHMGGEYEKAIKAHKRAAEFDQVRGVSLYNLACAYSLTGQVDKAFKALEAAHEAGFDLTDPITSDSDLENVRKDPRFGDLMADLDLEV